MSLKQTITHNLLNIPGWHTNRKIVVIESDDWGSVRMPSREVYDEFLTQGVRVDKDPYCRYDGLATKQDLSNLFEVLDSVRDKNGYPAVLTADTVVTNPDFEKIKASGFSDYYYEPFTETLAKSSRHEGAFELWQQGMSAGLFHPQFHGREHLNVKKWMKTLQEGHESTRLAFELGSFGLTSAVDPTVKNNYMGAFNSGIEQDMNDYRVILNDGLNLFEQLFGYRSESFIATTYTWNPGIEKYLKECGVKYLQGLVTQKIPYGDDCNIKFRKKNFQGTKSPEGLIYLMRNVFFEPSQTIKPDAVDDCLYRIKLAFRWGKAAVICAHRLNFIGSIDPRNTDRNLPMFREFLKRIVKQWPDVEFLTSDQLGKIIEES